MRYYNITVEGKCYQVGIEEGQAPAVASAQAIPRPVPQPMMPGQAIQSQSPTPLAGGIQAAADTPGSFAGSEAQARIRIEAPMGGKILSLRASAGQRIVRGTCILTMEAMKMETEIVAPEDGILTGILCREGEQVEAGTLLATLS